MVITPDIDTILLAKLGQNIGRLGILRQLNRFARLLYQAIERKNY